MYYGSPFYIASLAALPVLAGLIYAVLRRCGKKTHMPITREAGCDPTNSQSQQQKQDTSAEHRHGNAVCHHRDHNQSKEVPKKHPQR